MSSRPHPRAARSKRAYRPLLLLTLVGTWMLSVGACGSDAVGVDACRKIETARCRAAEACGLIDDADSCERFYRDHCLHGLGVAQPSDREVDACTTAIEMAGECAQSGGEADECDRACRVVSAPERARECAFLRSSDDEEPGEGGAGGAPNAGGAAGAGGTAEPPTAGTGNEGGSAGSGSPEGGHSGESASAGASPE